MAPQSSEPAIPTSVIIFGFPPSMTSFILRHFSQYGTILAYEPSPQGGNWLTVTYPGRWAAQKALTQNAHVLGGGIMIGVVLAGETQQPTRQEASAAATAAAVAAQKIKVDSTGEVFKGRGMGSGYVGPGIESDGGEARGQGLWTKAMDLVFGW